jgi:SAM-dependent methyltransferase
MNRADREQELRSFYDGEVSRRAARELDPERVSRRERFIGLLAARGCRNMLEIGCGPGRDGVHFVRAGVEYVGVDLAPKAVEHCRRLGLRAEQASVLDLPFADASFDAGWTMSTLVHVAGDDLPAALGEIARVLRRGAPLAVGLWGGTPREGPHGARFFAIRSDDDVRRALEAIGSIEAFETWPHPDDDAELHYQLVRVRVVRPVGPGHPVASDPGMHGRERPRE